LAREILRPEEARRLGGEFDAADGAARPRERYGAVAEELLAEAGRA
jgi:hypothetical protein